MKSRKQLIKHYEKSVKYWTQEIDEAVGYLASEGCPKEHADNIKKHLPEWADKLDIAESTLAFLKEEKR